jgi:hypothetical protein
LVLRKGDFPAKAKYNWGQIAGERLADLQPEALE